MDLAKQLGVVAIVVITLFLSVIVSLEINKTLDLSGTVFLLMNVVILAIIYFIEYKIYSLIQKKKNKNGEKQHGDEEED